MRKLIVTMAVLVNIGVLFGADTRRRSSQKSVTRAVPANTTVETVGRAFQIAEWKGTPLSKPSDAEITAMLVVPCNLTRGLVEQARREAKYYLDLPEYTHERKQILKDLFLMRLWLGERPRYSNRLVHHPRYSNRLVRHRCRL